MSNGWEKVGQYWGDAGATKRDSERLALQNKAEADAASAAVNQQKAYGMQMENQVKEEQFNIMQSELKQLKARDIHNKTNMAVDGAIRDGSYKTFNEKFLSDPEVKAMYNNIGVFQVEDFNPSRQEHLQAYKNSGMPEEVLQAIRDKRYLTTDAQGVTSYAELTDDDIKNISLAYPVVQHTDGSRSVQPLGEFIGTTGIFKNVYSEQDMKKYMDVVDRGLTTVQGIAGNINQSKLAKEAAETEKLKAEALKAKGEGAEAQGKADTSKLSNDLLTQILAGDGTAEEKLAKLQDLTNPKLAMERKIAEAQLEKSKVDLEGAKQNLVKGGQDITIKGLEIQGKKIEQQELVQGKEVKYEKLSSGLAQINDVLGRIVKLPDIPLVAKGASMVPGTDTYDFAKTLETIQSQSFLASIQEMRGLGALSEAEGKKLDTAIANLDIGQSKEQLKKNLNIVRDTLQSAQKKLGSITGQTDANTKAKKGYTTQAGIFYPDGTRLGAFIIQNGVPVKVGNK